MEILIKIVLSGVTFFALCYFAAIGFSAHSVGRPKSAARSAAYVFLFYALVGVAFYFIWR